MSTEADGSHGFIRATYDSFLEDDCPFAAASIAYYALLSIFPFLLAVAAVSTHFLEHERVQSAIQETLRAYLPERAHAMILENVQEAIRLRGPVGVAAVIAYLWSASAAVGAVRHSLNRIWDVKRRRPFWRRKLLEVGTTLALAGVLGALAIISVGLSILAELGWKIPLFAPFRTLILAGPVREAATLGLAFVAFLLVYSTLPNRPLRLRWLWPGALVAAVLFEVARHAAFWGLARFAQYQLVYGSMAGIVIFILWMYVAATILLIGAEIARCRAPLSPGGE
jgi:membrane protein